MSNLVLCHSIQFPLDYSNVKWFSDKEKQLEYFSDKIFRTVQNFQFIKENAVAILPFSYNTMLSSGVRYCYYNNDRKTIFAFITRFEWYSQDSCAAYLSIDVMQTFMFDYSIKNSLVEQTNYNIYRGVEQSIGVNNYETIRVVSDTGYIGTSNYCLVTCSCDLAGDFGTLENPNLKTAKGSKIDGVWYGENFYIINQDNIYKFLSYLSNYPWISSCITSMILIPSFMFGISGVTSITVGNVPLYWLSDYNNIESNFDGIDASLFLPDNYKNIALYQSPFINIVLMSYQGNVVTLNPYLFRDFPLISFQIRYNICDIPTVYLIPKNYDGGLLNFENMLVINSLPQMSTTVDNSKYVLAQNAHSMSQQKAQLTITNSLLQKQNIIAQTSLTQNRAYERFNDRWEQYKNMGNLVGSGLSMIPVIGGSGIGNVGNMVTTTQSMMQLNESQAYKDASYMIDKASLDASTALSKQSNTTAYNQMLAGAKDAQLVNPSIVGYSNNQSLLMNTANDDVIYPLYYILIKIPVTHERKTITDYLKMFGLQCNQVLDVVNSAYLNHIYWKLATVNIISTLIPLNFVEQIKDVYRNGVMIWGSADIYDYSFLEGD